MSESLLEQIGITKEELQKRVVERLCDRVMGTVECDGDGYEYSTDSQFARKLAASVEEAVDKRIEEIGAKYVDPQVSEIVEKLTIQRTNEYGDKKGKPYTFVEYMASRAEAYLMESVDSQGNPKTADRYNTATQTRLTHLVDQHLHYAVSTAMNNAVKNANTVLADALTETCKIKLAEIVAKLEVKIEPKR